VDGRPPGHYTGFGVTSGWAVTRPEPYNNTVTGPLEIFRRNHMTSRHSSLPFGNHREQAPVKEHMRLAGKFVFLAFLALMASVYGASFPGGNAKPTAAPLPPLWGDLQPGQFGVGFRTIFRYDGSRTWKLTRNRDGAFLPDASGRPIQMNLWYPAKVDPAAKPVRLEDYVNQSAPEAFATLNSVMKQRTRDDAIGAVPRGEIPSLQSAEMNAFREAVPAEGRFPMILYFGGLNAAINANAILAEYLASHGYIVLSISLIGPSDEQTFQSRTAGDFEASVRDMEFAWSLLRDEPHVDKTNLAVMGHSVGAIEAVILGLRNANISAVIGLDGTYGFEGLSSVLTQTYGYQPERMRAAFLDLRRARGAQGNAPLDLTAVESFRHADRTFITIDKMHHSDFTSFAMIGAQFHAALPTGYPLNGWNRETGRAGYEQTCRIIVDFLNSKMKSDRGAAAELDRQVQAVAGISMGHEAAVPVAPSPLEAAVMASGQGLDATKAAFIRSCGESDLASCMDIDRFNTWGYTLMSQQRSKDALVLFELNAWAHPHSANAQDSLADGYLATEDKESARQAIERAIALAPADASFDTAARASFLTDERAKLHKTK
jgi:hypothetical protein